MQSAKSPNGRFLFDINEWLTINQVRSYFIRARSITIQKNAQLSQSIASNGVVYNDNEHEEEQDFDKESSAEVGDVVVFSKYKIYSQHRNSSGTILRCKKLSSEWYL